ncbi:MAG: hypothetical protein RIE53_09040 [Rhodothermales bacterium]
MTVAVSWPTMLLYAFALVLLLGVGALLALRWMDARADRAEWQRLRATQPAVPALFTPDMVADLPEPARRFFLFAIQPGTPLRTVAELTMEGEFSLGTRENPAYKVMRANQILAAPHGFVWKLTLPGPVPISGSDAGTWTRFRILGLIPVARAGGSEDHARSAFGRYVAEAVFWTPAALLPGPGVSWAAVDANTARVTVTHGGFTQAVDVAVDVDGRPHRVSFMRWTNANPENVFRLQPFGGLLSDFRNVDGFMLPFQADAGNHIGTDDWFPFFKAKITAIRFPAP